MTYCKYQTMDKDKMVVVGVILALKCITSGYFILYRDPVRLF